MVKPHMNQDWVCSTGRKTKQNNTKNKKQIWSFYTVCAIVFIPFEFLRFTRVPWLFAFVLFLICFVWLVGFVFFFSWLFLTLKCVRRGIHVRNSVMGWVGEGDSDKEGLKPHEHCIEGSAWQKKNKKGSLKMWTLS